MRVASVRILEKAVACAGLFAARACLLPMIALAAAAPLCRWLGLGNLPFADAPTSLFFILTMTTLGYAQVAEAHVRLDLLSRHWSGRTRAAIALCGTLLVLVPLCLRVIADGARSTALSWQQGERWGGTDLPLQWLVRASVPLGFLLLLLAALAGAWRAARRLRAE